MINLGIVKPGTTIIVPFQTFDSNDPSASVTITGLATTDIEIYKDGGVTQRASDAGYTLLDTDGIDFDTTTGIHGVSINLSDNTTAGFYASGSQYMVVIASITVDAATINFIPVIFQIGYPDAVLNTTIATLASQTSFTLTSGPAEDNALRGCVFLIHDVASAVQMGFAVCSAYTGTTKTVTLAAGTTFTAAASDNIAIYPPTNVNAWKGVDLNTTNPLPNAAADAAGGLPISDAGGLDLDALNTAAVRLTAARAQIIDDWVNGGRLDLILDIIAADTTTDIPALIATAQADLDTITGTDGVTLATAQALYAPAKAGDNMGTVTSVTGNVGGNVVGSVGSVTGGATAAELAKVPKSDGTVTWNATALASINAEADTALSDYDPPTNAEMEARTPTAAQLAYIVANAATGKPVTFSGTGTTTTGTLALVDGVAPSATNDQYKGRLLVFNAGTLDECVTDITGYNGTTKVATVTAVPVAITSSHTARLI